MAKGPPGRDAVGPAGTLTPRRRWPDLASAPGPLIHHPPRPIWQVTPAQQPGERLTLARFAPQLGRHKLNSPENHQNSVTGRFTADDPTALLARTSQREKQAQQPVLPEAAWINFEVVLHSRVRYSCPSHRDMRH